MARVKREIDPDGGAEEEEGYDFTKPSSSIEFISSGCTLFNLVLGGGWALGRISNIIGNFSSGKSLLAIEACSQFADKYPKGKIWYREAESAFDKDYARALGMPIEKVSFLETTDKFDTVEDFYNDLKAQSELCISKKVPGLYIIDSLDALSDEKELEREITDASFGTSKAKQMSTLFRKLVRGVGDANMHLMVISQVRDKIGVTFGRKTARSGGKALDFYASQIVHLTEIEKVYKTRKKQKRAVALRVKAKCDKNKVGLSFRECEYSIRFGYGIEDLHASLTWLKEVGRLKDIDLTDAKAQDLIDDSDTIPEEEYRDWLTKANTAVKRAWQEIETDFIPKRRKIISA